ncbi:hypothetical protein ACQYAD_01705 [Neobacillus sp. SM06]|uniref:hypothetical protein n=1 Tax=Neobacillus sp. SM06 TaxID=3422492 RepID=UPI003D2BB20C
MRKRVGCLHAHYSNIEYIENVFSPFDVELIHFVDPGLMYQVMHNENVKKADAQSKVKEQIEWIAQCHVEAILITCTNYIVILQEVQLSISVPIIKIDEPFFEQICTIQKPQIILFSNPATVEGTMERLYHFARDNNKSLDIEIMILNNTFELIMQGRKKEYNQEITKFLNNIIEKEDKVISVAQLSMVEASRQVEKTTSMAIINPLHTLVSSIVNRFDLQKKKQ